MNRLSISLFGPFQASLDGQEIVGFKSQRVRSLLAYLTVEAERAHSRDTLAALLWPDWPDQEAHNNLRYALYNLRQAIQDRQADPPFLIIGRDTIQINPASEYSLDVRKFNQLLSDHQTQHSNPDRLLEAIGLYQGEFMEGFELPESLEFDEWVTLKRAELHRLLVEALGKMADTFEARGDYGQALIYARRQVELEPWQEKGQRQIMRLLTGSDERSAAILHYERYRQRLSNELGVLPDEETQKLFLQIQKNSKGLELPDPSRTNKSPRAIGECPYRGLSAFREQDAPFYCGRSDYIEHLQQTLQAEPLVIVLIGPSGSGKSSLIYAGLIPRIRSQKAWLIVEFRPGARPFHALAAALMPWLDPTLSETDRLIETQKLAEAILREEISLRLVAERILEKQPQIEQLLLFADQFEELYTLCQDEGLRRCFLDALMEAAAGEKVPRIAPIKMLLTLRADFMGQALSYRPFTDVLQKTSQMLGPMSQAELREAVEKPAEKQGASFETGLIERILEDVGERSGNLPLLEFALTLLWDQVVDGVLTHAAYEKIGQVEGALTRYAEQVYSRLKPAEQVGARQIFMQLILPGKGTEDIRRVARRSEIGEENWELVQYLADKRLIVTDRDADGSEIAEIIHEALIQQWNRLKDWKESDRSFRIWQEALRSSIQQWESAARDESGLLRGIPLAQAENWMAERAAELSILEKQFIQESTLQRQRHEEERQQQQQQELEKARALARTERRARRFMGALAGVLAIAVLVTVALTVFANQQRRRSLEAYSLSLAASAEQALADRDTSTALSLALAANRIENPPRQAQRTLLNNAYAPGPRSRAKISALFPGTIGSATCLAISSKGDKILFGLADGKLVLWDPTSMKFQILMGHTNRVNDVAIAPDGFTALSGGEDHQVIYWDLRTGAEIYRLVGQHGGHSGVVRTVAFRPDGKLAVTGGQTDKLITNPGELILWDLESGQEIRRFLGHNNGVVDAQFTPDGQKILSSSGDMEITIEGEKINSQSVTNDLLLWNAETGELKTRFDGLNHDVMDIDISPDGTQALLGSYYNHVISLLNLNTGKKLGTLSGHRNAVRAVAFLPNSNLALSASDDGSLILWDLTNDQPLVNFKAADGNQLDLAIRSDGRDAFSVTRDGDLFQWDLQAADVIKRFGFQNDMIYDIDYTPDGKKALSCAGSPSPSVLAQDPSLRLWDIQSGELLQTMRPPVQVNFQCAVSPDGRWALSGANDGLVRLWDLKNGQEIRQLKGHTDWAISMAFSPNGKYALTGSKDGSLIYWDLEQGQALRKMFSEPNDNWSVAISPDGRTALSDAAKGGAIYWDLATGKEIRRLVRNDLVEVTGVSGVAYAPDGKTAVTGGNDGSVIQWDLNTGKEIRGFGRHDGIRTRVEISRDGKIMLTSGINGVMRLWDLPSGELVREFGYTGQAVLFDIKLSPDGLSALSGTIDQSLTLWSLKKPTLAELKDWITQNRYVRDLTCAERASYQIEPLCATK